MAKKSERVDRIAQLAGQLAAQLGYELVDAELAMESAGRFLRFYIDREGGIMLNDLETYHRKILPLMDDIDYDYMEVSSPGADRPLKKPDDFVKAMGKPIEVRLYRPIDGVKRLRGELVGLKDDCVVLRVDGVERAIPLKLAAKISPVLPELGDMEIDEGDGESDEGDSPDM